MKKVFFAAGLLALLLWTAGCSLNDNTAGPSATVGASATPSASAASPSADSPEPSNSEPASTPDDNTSAEPSGSTDASPSVSFTPPTVGDNGDADYPALGQNLMKTESIGTIKLGLTESDLVKALGQPDDKSDPEVWDADDLKHTDWSYESKGLIVDLVEAAGTKSYTVYSIRASEGCTLKTKRGVAVGDSKADVLEAYDKEYNAGDSGDGTLVLGSLYGGINITLDQDDKVAEIFIGPSA